MNLRLSVDSWFRPFPSLIPPLFQRLIKIVILQIHKYIFVIYILYYCIYVTLSILAISSLYLI